MNIVQWIMQFLTWLSKKILNLLNCIVHHIDEEKNYDSVPSTNLRKASMLPQEFYAIARIPTENRKVDSMLSEWEHDLTSFIYLVIIDKTLEKSLRFMHKLMRKAVPLRFNLSNSSHSPITFLFGLSNRNLKDILHSYYSISLSSIPTFLF